MKKNLSATSRASSLDGNDCGSVSRRTLLKAAGAAALGALTASSARSETPPDDRPQRAEIADAALWRLCTERARRAISWAQEEAGQAGMPEVETEHLLLAMLREDNLGAGVLVRCGLSLETLRSAVRKEMASGPAGRGRVTRLGPGARRALDLAREEGEAMDPAYVGCEHLLLGLLRQKEGLAARVLARLGVTQERCRREIPIVGAWWFDVLEAEARLREGDTPEKRHRLQEALTAYHAFIRQTPRLEARPE